MTLTQLISKIKRDHPDTQGFDDTQITTELNQSQLEIAQVTKCLPAENDQTLLLTTENHPLPDDFLDIDREGGVHAKILSSNTKFQRLVYRSMEELDTFWPSWRDDAAGTPHSYFIRGKNIKIYPKKSTAAVASGLRIYYFKSPIVMTAALSPWDNVSYLSPFHPLVVLHAARVILTAIKRYQEAAAVEALLVDGLAVMNDFMENRLLSDFSPNVKIGIGAMQFAGRRAGRF